MAWITSGFVMDGLCEISPKHLYQSWGKLPSWSGTLKEPTIPKSSHLHFQVQNQENNLQKHKTAK